MIRRSGRRRAAAALAAASLLGSLPAAAWYMEGHRRIGAAAAAAAGTALPEFFAAGAATVGHVAVDPDVWKNPGTAALRAGEEPSHYLDWERLPPGDLPGTRMAFVARLASLGIDLAGVGTLPYSVLEGTERLALCFAEHRRWPDAPDVRAKCLVYAGWLAHYAADLVQPLHTTIHHDGWALPGGASPLQGFHVEIDKLIERAPYDPVAALEGLEVEPFADPREGVIRELEASHALVDRVYRLEGSFLASERAWEEPEAVAFACERYRESVRFVARLYRTAWEMSARLKLPEALERVREAPEPPPSRP